MFESDFSSALNIFSEIYFIEIIYLENLIFYI